MASVSSLDQDMRRLRMDRYTPQAANEVREWIENTLGERLPSNDLLECLKDGTVLCRLANLVLPAPGIKFRASSMPFTQRENISHFLTACEAAPLHLPAHDRFLTVDLYEEKDPAQVIQCIGAFSRAANAVNPSRVPTVIGPKRPPSPTKKFAADAGNDVPGSFNRSRGLSTVSNGSDDPRHTARAASPALLAGRSSPTVSSWSKKSDEATTAPAWNIHQYGYMGGANQGNQGIAFGTRRQITAAQPHVPSLAEKEKRRKEQEAEAERQRAEDAERERVRIETEAARRQEEQEQRRLEEQRAREEEEARWEAETQKARERERIELEEERKRLEERRRLAEEREKEQRKRMEEKRLAEEREKAEEQLQLRQQEIMAAAQQQSSEPKRDHSALRGQYLSQYQAEQRATSESPNATTASAPQSSESERIRELERQLQEARERERQYELERQQQRLSSDTDMGSPNNNTYRRPSTVTSPLDRPTPQLDGDGEADLDNTKQAESLATRPHPSTPSFQRSTRPLPNPSSLPSNSPFSRYSPFSRRPKPLDPPQAQPQPAPPPSATAEPPQQESAAAPPPVDAKATEYQAGGGSRTDRFLAQNPAPVESKPASHFPQEMGFTSTAERAAEDARRIASQASTKAGGWASKSLLEREMERERERQREWEEAQLARSKAAFGNSKGLIGPRELTKK